MGQSFQVPAPCPVSRSSSLKHRAAGFPILKLWSPLRVMSLERGCLTTPGASFLEKIQEQRKERLSTVGEPVPDTGQLSAQMLKITFILFSPHYLLPAPTVSSLLCSVCRGLHPLRPSLFPRLPHFNQCAGKQRFLPYLNSIIGAKRKKDTVDFQYTLFCSNGA